MDGSYGSYGSYESYESYGLGIEKGVRVLRLTGAGASAQSQGSLLGAGGLHSEISERGTRLAVTGALLRTTYSRN